MFLELCSNEYLGTNKQQVGALYVLSVLLLFVDWSCAVEEAFSHQNDECMDLSPLEEYRRLPQILSPTSVSDSKSTPNVTVELFFVNGSSGATIRIRTPHEEVGVSFGRYCLAIYAFPRHGIGRPQVQCAEIDHSYFHSNTVWMHEVFPLEVKSVYSALVYAVPKHAQRPVYVPFQRKGSIFKGKRSVHGCSNSSDCYWHNRRLCFYGDVVRDPSGSSGIRAVLNVSWGAFVKEEKQFTLTYADEPGIALQSEFTLNFAVTFSNLKPETYTIWVRPKGYEQSCCIPHRDILINHTQALLPTTSSSERITVPGVHTSIGIVSKRTKVASRHNTLASTTVQTANHGTTTRVTDLVHSTIEVTGSVHPAVDVTGSVHPAVDVTGSVHPAVDVIGSVHPAVDVTGSVHPAVDVTGSVYSMVENTTLSGVTEDLRIVDSMHTAVDATVITASVGGSIAGVSCIIVIAVLTLRRRRITTHNKFEKNKQTLDILCENQENNNDNQFILQIDAETKLQYRKKICLVYFSDHVHHSTVVAHFADHLQYYCFCDVVCLPWQPGHALGSGENGTVRLTIQQSDFLLIILSEGLTRTYIHSKRTGTKARLTEDTSDVMDIVEEICSGRESDQRVLVQLDDTPDKFALNYWPRVPRFILMSEMNKLLSLIHGTPVATIDSDTLRNNYDNSTGTKISITRAIRKEREFESGEFDSHVRDAKSSLSMSDTGKHDQIISSYVDHGSKTFSRPAYSPFLSILQYQQGAMYPSTTISKDPDMSNTSYDLSFQDFKSTDLCGRYPGYFIPPNPELSLEEDNCSISLSEGMYRLNARNEQTFNCTTKFTMGLQDADDIDVISIDGESV